MSEDRRPVELEIRRHIRHLKNRRDTLVRNIVIYSRSGYAEAIRVCRDEAKRVNNMLMTEEARLSTER